MTSGNITGLVILFKSDKSLLQTRKVRIFQRENLVDIMKFLIPFTYNDISLEPYKVTMQYLMSDGTVKSEFLERLSDHEGGYEDYYDKYDNPTHMIYCLPINSNLTRWSGDITIKLTMDYIDYEGQTTSNNDNESAPDPEPVHHVINSGTTVITVLPVADYYSTISDDSLEFINNKIAELNAAELRLEETAKVYDQSKGDNIELHIDKTSQCIRLTSHGEPIGEDIDLNTLGIELAAWTESGLVKVITDEDEPEPVPPEPEPSEKYADDIVLVINENTKAIYLTSNGRIIGTPIDLNDLGIALGDWTTEGLVKVITDEDSENASNSNDDVITDEEDG